MKELQAASIEGFATNFKTRGAVERRLQVSVECVIDVGNEVVSSLQLRRPEHSMRLLAVDPLEGFI